MSDTRQVHALLEIVKQTLTIHNDSTGGWLCNVSMYHYSDANLSFK